MVEEYSFLAFGFSDLVVTGPDPFSSNSLPRSSAYGETTIQIAPDAAWTVLTMTDNDGFLEDGDSRQNLTEPLSINGMNYNIGQNVEIEYSYVIRPVGSTDSADDITIYVLEFGTRVQGIASNQLLDPNVTYLILSGENGPKVPYGDLVICFTPGTDIATLHGPVPVDLLRPGDLVCTVDNGPQPLIWIGNRIAAGVGPGTPVKVAAGVLGNARPLLLSQQHRVLIPQALGLGPDLIAPVKALVGLPGVDYAPRQSVSYIHLMFERHELIFAEGAQAESFLPGPQALKALSCRDRAALQSLVPSVRQKLWAGVRPMLRAGQARRAMERAAPMTGTGGYSEQYMVRKHAMQVLTPRNIAPGGL